MRPASAFLVYQARVRTLCAVCVLLALLAVSAPAQEITSYSLLTKASRLRSSDLSELRARADFGDAHAQVLLGTAYEYGLGVRQNFSTAEKWFLLAARAGDPMGETLLGQIYQRRAKLSSQKASAFSWFRRAADQGSAEAQFELAKEYAHGWGVPADEREAAAMYRMAADNGFAPAKCVLDAQNPEYPRASGAGITPPRALNTLDPEYSDSARAARLNGSVELWLGVGADGLVHEACISQPLGLGLDEQAVEAVRQWKFHPATRNGEPIAVGLIVTTTFRLY